jgi:hypothetical protein
MSRVDTQWKYHFSELLFDSIFRDSYDMKWLISREVFIELWYIPLHRHIPYLPQSPITIYLTKIICYVERDLRCDGHFQLHYNYLVLTD